MKLLLIEDDVRVAQILAEAFVADGHETTIRHTGEDGLAHLAREMGQAVFPGMPDRRLVAVRHERLRENLSHAHVILDQEELHPSPSRPSGTPPSSQGPRDFFNVTRGCEDRPL